MLRKYELGSLTQSSTKGFCGDVLHFQRP